MSLAIMAEVWRRNVGNHCMKLVTLALADNASDEGHCWPSMATLSAKCGLSEQGVRNCVKQLEDKGVVEVVRGIGRTSSRYQFNLEKLEQFPVVLKPRQRKGEVEGVEDRGQGRLGQRSTPLGTEVNGVDRNRNGTATEAPKDVASAGSQPSPAPGESDAVKFRVAFMQSYKARVGVPYVFGGAKDGSAIKRMLSAGQTADSLCALLGRMSAAPDGWAFKACKAGLQSVAVMAMRINEINAELSADRSPEARAMPVADWSGLQSSVGGVEAVQQAKRAA